MAGRLRNAAAALLLSAVTLGILFGSLELFATARGHEPLIRDARFDARYRARACRWNPADVRERCDPARWKRQPPAGEGPVWVAGGCSARGQPAGGRRNAAHSLRERLESERPGVFAVRSLARPCKGSYFVSACFRRAIASHPSVLVVYTGHNDFSGHRSRHPQIPIWTERFGWPLLELERGLARTRFWSMLSPSGRLPLTPRNDPGFALTPEQSARSNRIILDNTLRNLEDTIALASEHGVPVMLLTLVSNLYEFPTRRTDWDALLAGERDDDFPAADGREAFVAGVGRFREARHAEALASFRHARDAWPGPRAPGLLNAAIRDLAARRSDAHLVDVEARLDALALEEGIGCNYFGTDVYCDGLHPNPRTSRLIGEWTARAILELDGGA